MEMRLGIIGTGQMGGMLARSFAQTGVATILLYTRTLAKALAIQEEYPEAARIAVSMEQMVQDSDYLFLCMKSPEVRKWIEIWGDQLDPAHCVVSINSQISLAELEESVSAQVVKIIPSITQMALSGTILYMPGPRATKTTAAPLLNLLEAIGHPLPISEGLTRIYADLSSCGPAFYATLVKQMASAAQKKGVPVVTAEQLLIETLAGLVLLVKENGLTLTEVAQRVSVPGGVTEAGVSHLNESIPAVFDRLFSVTAQKQEALDRLT